jgi:hypothetical protein
MLHAAHTIVPRQVTCVTIDSGTSNVDLPFSTSLLIYPHPKNVPSPRGELRGLQIWRVAEALCMNGPQFLVNSLREAEIALARLAMLPSCWRHYWQAT